MRMWQRVLVVTASVSALSAPALDAASEDGKAAFERRADTMKHLGRPLYLGIGRVVKGYRPLRPGYGYRGGDRRLTREHPRPEFVSAGFGRGGEQDQAGDLHRPGSRRSADCGGEERHG